MPFWGKPHLARPLSFPGQRAIRRMTALRQQGKSYRQVADALTREGVPPRHGKWHYRTVERILRREEGG